MNPITRVPRIKGLTLLSLKYQEDQGDETKYFRIINSVTTHYTTNGFTYMGYPLSLPELSYYTNTNEASLQKAVVKGSGIFSSLLNGTTQEEISAGIRNFVECLISDAFEDKYRYRKLVNGLEANLLYSNKKPNLNVTHAYIKGLELGTKQTATLMNLLSYLLPKSSTNIAIFNTPTGPTKDAQQQAFLTRDEALKLIEDPAQKALNNPQIIQSLEAEYLNPSIPEVRANGSEEKGPLATKLQQADGLNDFIIEDISDALLLED